MTENKKIKEGQFWLVESGSVALVTGRNGDDTCWLANRVDSGGGFINGVGISDRNFERQLTPEEAKKIAIRNVEKKICDLLQL